MSEANGHIDHSGRIERIDGNRLYVAIVSNSACGSCRARKACGVSESAEKIVEVETADAAEYSVGEEVTVSVRRNVGLRAVLFAYTIPLVVLVALLAGLKAAGCSDGASAAASLVGVTVYYLILWLLRGRMAEKIRFLISKK